MLDHRVLSHGVIRTATFVVALHFALTMNAHAQVVVSGLEQPVAFAQHPGDPAVWFVAQQNGIVWLLRNRVRQPTPFLDLRGGIGFGGENGLLGLAFPPDYAASGRAAQNPGDLRGKILRIDVSSVALNHPNGFVVPPDNPFVDDIPVDALPEIWAFGLRNPWKISFDNPTLGGTGALLIGDVGQGAREEIDFEPIGQGGRNYGWARQEGGADFDPVRPIAFGPLTGPIHDYGRASGASVTGGYVYRGSRQPSRRVC